MARPDRELAGSSVRGVGCGVWALTLLHFLATECRPGFVVWASALSILRNEVSRYDELNAPAEFLTNNKYRACVAKLGLSALFWPGPVKCDNEAWALDFGTLDRNVCTSNTQAWEDVVGSQHMVAVNTGLLKQTRLVQVGGECMSAGDSDSTRVEEVWLQIWPEMDQFFVEYDCKNMPESNVTWGTG